METLFFYFTKTAWALLAPDALMLLSITCGFILLFTQKQKLAKKLIGLPLICGLVIALLPVDEWLLIPLEQSFPANPNLPNNIDGIIVLGGAIDTLAAYDWQQPELNGAGERMTEALSLARQHPQATIVFTGGSGRPRYQTIREAEYARQFFQQQGISESRVFFESASRNTYENALYSKELVQAPAHENWVLVTSASHMPRAIGAFCQQQWSLLAYPVDHRTSPSFMWRVEFQFASNLASLKQGLYEYAGLIVYRIAGKTPALFPSAC